MKPMRWALLLLAAASTAAYAADAPPAFEDIRATALQRFRGDFQKLKGSLNDAERRSAGKFEAFSFAVITDFQTGQGVNDFGTAGYDDSLDGIPEDDEGIRKIRAAIEKVNALAGTANIKFVFVAGDLTNSAERSEYQAAKLLLDDLRVPYFPIIGNHDMWPYVWKGGEAPGPLGKSYFDETFGDYVRDLPKVFPGTIRPAPEKNSSGDYINYTFTYQGIGFIAADWNSRIPSRFGPGASPGAMLHDADGGTFRWLDGLLKGGWHEDKSRVFLLQHHPFRAKMPREIAGCFSRADSRRMRDFLKERLGSPKLGAVLAGHQHRTYDGPAFDGWPELLQIETDSARESSNVTVVTVVSPTRWSFGRY